MPVPALDKCFKCKGETDAPRKECLACAHQRNCNTYNVSRPIP